jgi:decaprenyl-phosphate phosphoribosyltransferase
MQQIVVGAPLKSYLKLMRLKQYTKNLFVFIPPFFAGIMFQEGVLLQELVAFVSFSLVASAIYILNDYIDIDKDRLHPQKRTRPLASGVVSVRQASLLFISCLLSGLTLAYFLDSTFLLVLAVYFVMNLFYSLSLKKISLVDISIIAIGFLLRIFAGAVVEDIIVSKWLIMMTFLLALLMGLAKRRDDVLIKDSTGQEMRKSIQGYNIVFTNVAMVFLASVTVVAYIMYTVSPEVIARIGSENIYLTSFFVIMGILRYLQITLVEEASASPTDILLKDVFVQLTLLGWVVTFAVLLYLR